MGVTSLHPELEDRLADLAREIAKLRLKANRTRGFDRVEALAEVGQLEHRYVTLEQRLSLLGQRRRGFGHNFREEFEELWRELTDAVEELISWTDSDYWSNQRLKLPFE